MRRRAAVIGEPQCGVVSRRQLLSAGVTRWQIRAELRAQRWRAHGRQTIALHCGPLVGRAPYWYAVFEAGPRAAIDGAGALVVAGTRNLEVSTIRVSVPRGAPAMRREGLLVRQTRRLVASDVVSAGLPRGRPEVAAVRAALWACSDRQAATILAMTVQQRIASATGIGRALLEVRRDRRRRLVDDVLVDVMGGAHSLGELDFTRTSRAYGLPEPDRQVLRRGRSGRVYLDLRWSDFAVVAEVDGAQHLSVEASVLDAVRHNDLAASGETVLRIPVLGLRVAPDVFLEQVATALVRAGWQRPPRTSRQVRPDGGPIGRYVRRHVRWEPLIMRGRGIRPDEAPATSQ